MEMEKSSPELIEFFTNALPRDPDVEHKKMFGYPTCFVKGNMFTGLHGSSMTLRLGEEKRQEFIGNYNAHLFEPMPGRPMREYVVVPTEVLADTGLLAIWLQESLTYVRSLPIKEKKTKVVKARVS